MPKRPDLIDLRVSVSPALYAKIGGYRHTARHDSKNQALMTLLAAGLAAMTKPVTLPPPVRSKLIASAR